MISKERGGKINVCVTNLWDIKFILFAARTKIKLPHTALGAALNARRGDEKRRELISIIA